MNFNFEELYATYPTSELLKIKAQPEGYEASAVAAAETELSIRHVSEADLALAGLAKTVTQTVDAKDAWDGTDLFADEPMEITKAYKIFRAVAVTFYIIQLLLCLFVIYRQIQVVADGRFYYFILEDMAIHLLIAVVPFPAIYLFLRRLKTGWIILFTWEIISSAWALFQLVRIVSVLKYGLWSFGAALIVVSHLLLLIGLNRRDIYKYSVSEDQLVKYRHRVLMSLFGLFVIRCVIHNHFSGVSGFYW